MTILGKRFTPFVDEVNGIVGCDTEFLVNGAIDKAMGAMREEIRTKEAIVRAGLIKLGWTPPPEVDPEEEQ